MIRQEKGTIALLDVPFFLNPEITETDLKIIHPAS